jgi:RimJ/RimL family protein N-acetyltransferase
VDGLTGWSHKETKAEHWKPFVFFMLSQAQTGQSFPNRILYLLISEALSSTCRPHNKSSMTAILFAPNFISWRLLLYLKFVLSVAVCLSCQQVTEAGVEVLAQVPELF